MAYACGVTGAASLAFWRRWPLAVAAIAAVTSGVYVARGYPDGPALLPGPLALLALGYQAPRRVAWIGAAAYLASALIARAVGGDGTAYGEVLAVVGLASAAVLAGQAIAARGERAAAQRERLAHQEEQAIAAERLRIAQDLHDSVAHAMATINVQSGVAAHLLDRDPSQAKRALEAIRVASSDALDELGAILGVLRDPDADAPLAPVSTPCRRRIAGRARPRGRAPRDRRRTRVGRLSGELGELGGLPSRAGSADQRPPSRRQRGHGHAGRRDRRPRDGDGRASATTAKDRRPNGSSTGLGLVGMRERVESTGGLLRTGPRPRRRLRGRRHLERSPVIRVLLADDQVLVRSGFRALLDAEDDIEVVGEAADGAEAVELTRRAAARRRADGHPHAQRRRAHRGATDRRGR